MRKVIVALLIAVAVSAVWAQTSGGPGIGDDFYPTLGNGGYDVQLYVIDIDVSDNLEFITSASVTIEAQAMQDLSDFNLDFLGMTVDQLLVNGDRARYTRDGREMTITPASPLNQGEPFTVEVTYHGAPGTDSDGDSIQFNNGWYAYSTGIFVASEPDGSAQWFPSNDHPLDKAKFRFVISVPAPYVVAANGTLTEVVEEDGRSTYTWDMAYPMATYLATVNVQEFVERTDTSESGIPIRNYFPADLADDAEATFARQDEMIDLFEELFGPYPFDVYGVVVADINLGFALETQTMSLFGKNHVEQGVSPSGIPSESVIAHELAHQWFGDSLTPATWQDLWLNEGFATYAQVLWAEFTAGTQVASRLLGNFYAQIRNPMMITQGVAAPGNPPPDRLFNTGVYVRGAWVLHALRLHIGDDDVFFDLLRTYTDRFKYGNVRTQDFIDLAVEISGDPAVIDLLNAWIYEEAVPDVPQMGLFGTGD